jgi:molybdenum cofactor biosynthesis enzyme MoaA
MHRAGILKTVSFTGGEPSLCPQIEELVKLIPSTVFTTINTNGWNIKRLVAIQPDWINLSRHYADDAENRNVFGCAVPTIEDLKALDLGATKLRLQAVVNETTTLDPYLELIDSGVCHDVSFRSRMLTGHKEVARMHEQYLSLIDSALKAGSKVIEQEIQDYYVYEVHKLAGRTLTFSYSNMEAATQGDKTAPKDFIREFILKPNGSLYSSWEDKTRVLLAPLR